ncbi:PAS domain-containing protein [Devosia sp. ZB163]|uniref:PAS domain-containing protein n=1 Tax=Devosia sp. ZB163 TaxID=3025938 RepID=UPI00235E9956|nr:PAS domain-containing protein [Devosia sp. ZB163]MDC9823891.1 PAS domain-containing protein [Devosia sp. ZB163]
MNDESDVHHRTGDLLARAEDRGTIGSWSWQAGQDQLEWSVGLYRLAGMEAFSVIPTLDVCRNLVHPDDLRAVGNWQALLAMEWLDDRIFRVIRPDGELRRVRLHGRAVRASDGGLLGISGICIDVTDRQASAVREDPGLTHAQVRAARAYLGWTAIELAEKAGVSFSTVRRVEMPGRRAVRDANLDAIRDAFTRSGVRFVVHDDGAIGIVGR